jgi:hypothetical protein
MNVYDEQLVNDGRILHALGLILQRQESGALQPKPVPPRCAWCEQEAGVRPANSNRSHGICDRHFAAMKEQVAKWHRLAA